MAKKMTPLMQQYWEIKNQHQDKILLFRMGDFFELFHQDAVISAPILNIALTSRNKKAKDETPMCGVPHHSIAGPIAKLLGAGHKVAICDQVEDPKQAKGIVKRAVTRMLSPGMVYDPETLDELKANYLCSVDSEAISFLETSTGEAFYYLTRSFLEKRRLRQILSPTEVVLSTEQSQKWKSDLSDQGLFVSHFDFGEDFVPDTFSSSPESLKRLVCYARVMQGEEVLNTLQTPEERRLHTHMEISPVVARHLEMFQTYKGEVKGSLFFAINRTKTSAGARLFKSWLRFPLASHAAIEKRLDQVSLWMREVEGLKKLRDVLGSMGDVERRLGKISNPGCNARDLISLTQSLRAGLTAASLHPEPLLQNEGSAFCQKLIEKIENCLVEEPPLSIKEGGIIREGFSPELDELIDTAKNSQTLLRELEEREREETGISSLKVRYNNVFGYYIEVTKTHSSKVPETYQRKQTLTNAERYTTDELHVLEEKVIRAKTRRSDLEYEIFQELRKELLAGASQLLELSRAWSEIDVLSSLAWLALEQNYVRPQFSEDRSLILEHSRHPVVEQEMAGTFVPNTLELKASECLLLTGPNMAGKSTLMRQVAVASIMAQVGSFVPAAEAKLPLFDRIFTRIGASDDLAEGLSTFMVEMKEASEMLAQATANSLVVLDEVGRGTSTYDGMSLAQAILEHLVADKSCMTLFATHYHELTHLSQIFPQVHNAHMSIQEKGGEIEFLHTLVKGAASKSYGIQVARLAGLPKSVTKRANQLLKGHESFDQGNKSSGQMSLPIISEAEIETAEEQAEKASHPLLDEIRALAVQQITPLEALNKIADWQREL